MLLACTLVNAQQVLRAKDSTAGKSEIIILDNEEGIFMQNDTNAVHKLLGHVKLLHGTDTLFCDSAYFYTQRNSVEAFGNVLVQQLDGTEASADYMRYNGRTKTILMMSKTANSEVQLFDGKTNTIWSREVEYNLNTKIGKYNKRGYLQTETTVLESNKGTYNLRTKEARFTGNVLVSDPEYSVTSNDIGYNTETEIVTIFSPSIITNDQSILQTSKGYYNAKVKKAYFNSRSSVLNQAQYIESDTLDYSKEAGWAIAIGNVIAIDTGMKATLYCGKAEYNELKKTLLAYIEPIMKRAEGKDSMFVRADTFYTAPVPKGIKIQTGQDSLQQTAEEIKGAITKEETDSLSTHGLNDSLKQADTSIALLDNAITDTLLLHSHLGDEIVTDVSLVDTLSERKAKVAELRLKMDAIIHRQDNTHHANVSDTIQSDHKQQVDALKLSYDNKPDETDTSGPRYFIGYRNVVIYADSMQGKCDSIYYSQSDSLLHMFVNPVLWPNKGQLSGDIITMKLDSNKMREVIVPKNGIAIYRSGPDAANMFDQIQGNVLHGYLTDNKIDSLIASPEASSIYFIKDEDSAYVGSSEAKAFIIEVHFVNEEIEKIYYRKDVEQTTTPMKDVNPAALRLSRYSWQEEKRTKSLNEFLKGRELPLPQLLYIEERTDVDKEDD